MKSTQGTIRTLINSDFSPDLILLFVIIRGGGRGSANIIGWGPGSPKEIKLLWFRILCR